MTQTQKIYAEIERLIGEYENGPWEEIDTDSLIAILRELLYFIESLEKEQEAGDIQREWYNKGYIKGRKEAYIPARELGLPSSLDDNSPQVQRLGGER